MDFSPGHWEAVGALTVAASLCEIRPMPPRSPTNMLFRERPIDRARWPCVFIVIVVKMGNLSIVLLAYRPQKK